jgi:exodeoxyribonuclease V alpha subunit
MENSISQAVPLSLTEHIVRGEVSRIVFAREDGSYSVFKVVDNQGVEHTAVGNVLDITPGHRVELKGFWEVHPEYGRQLRVEHYNLLLPSTQDGLIRYLSSGIIPGVGVKLAESIVKCFGDNTINVLDNYSERLKEIPKIGNKRVQSIREIWHKQRCRRDIFIFLQGVGISKNYCERLYERYGEEAAAIVKKTPYQLADDISGIGFTTADNIAAAQGILKNNPQRLVAGAYYTMTQLTAVGHCCYPKDDFIKMVANTLQVEDEDATLGLEFALKNKTLTMINSESCTPMIYPLLLFAAEREIPLLLINLFKNVNHKGKSMLNIPSRPDLCLSNEQCSAVERAAISPVSIITGGPGVGKTTVIGEIVRRAIAAKLIIYLAAPTGRAAKRLSEATGLTAKTLHRLLRWEPAERGFAYNSKKKLPCDVLIVDEVSMLDTQLALNLLRAIRSGTTLVMVGDADQLPSVGPGNVLHSLIDSKLFTVTHLSKIFRQGAGSEIIVNAYRVNHGKLPEPAQSGQNVLSDFYWIEQDDPDKALELIIKMAKIRIPERFGFDPIRDIQVLSPMNRGSCGTIALNQRLQQELNPGHKPQFKIGDRIFKSGDKVIQNCNNYEKNVFNGDMGRIANIEASENKFTVIYDNNSVEYDYFEAEQLALAYAVTVHKSQGSEFPVVIVPILTQHYMLLQRNLLYTAMTRARSLLVLVGSKKAVNMAVNNFKQEPRYTLLNEFLRQIFNQ